MPFRINTLKLVCFSPTGTTRRILRGIERGINHDTSELIDLTLPGLREQRLQTSEEDLLLVAVPVYMGRVPALLLDWLNGITAKGSPVVFVVVYGNRAYEDALIELEDILVKRGCIPIAGAAYIGEHSYSSSAIPIARGRPDESDLDHAVYFGKRIAEKLRTYTSLDQTPKLNIPGHIPRGRAATIWNIDFIAVNKQCMKCGTCSVRCPVGAIDEANSYLADKSKCITCSACIRNCPQKARKMRSGPVKDAAKKIGRLYKERKEPVNIL